MKFKKNSLYAILPYFVYNCIIQENRNDNDNKFKYELYASCL